MNIKRKSTGDWAKSRSPLSEAEIKDISKFLNTLDIAKVAGGSGTIHPPNHDKKAKTGWRVDLQNPTKTDYNVQVQQNGIDNPSTVAAVLVPMDLVTRMGSAGNTESGGMVVAARGSELLYALHGALVRSARTIRHATSSKGKEVQGKYECEVLILDGSYSCGDYIRPNDT